MAPPTPLSIASRTLPEPPTLVARQDSATITVVSGVRTTYVGLSAGAIAGIVIGSLVGLILLILLARWALMSNQGGDVPPTPRRRYRHRHTHYNYAAASPHHSHSRSRSRSHGRHYRRSVEVVHPEVVEPQRVYVTQEPRYHSRGRPEWRG